MYLSDHRGLACGVLWRQIATEPTILFRHSFFNIILIVSWYGHNLFCEKTTKKKKKKKKKNKRQE